MNSFFYGPKTLDASADGYGRGEACACVLIACGDANEREEDEDTIKGDAVVAFAGSAVNQDGRSSSLTAPNGPSQRAVVREAAFGFGSGSGSGSGAVTEERVGGTRLLQMHGTGTPLGDPIEVNAAVDAFFFLHLRLRRRTSSSPTDDASTATAVVLVLEAVKSWRGHAEPAAGVLGLATLRSQLAELATHGQCHLRAMNPHASDASLKAFGRGGGVVAPRGRSAAVDARAASTRGGVSAFAFQGTNAHVAMARRGADAVSRSVDARWAAAEATRAWPAIAATRGVAPVRALPTPTRLRLVFQEEAESLEGRAPAHALHVVVAAVRAALDERGTAASSGIRDAVVRSNAGWGAGDATAARAVDVDAARGAIEMTALVGGSSASVRVRARVATIVVVRTRSGDDFGVSDAEAAVSGAFYTMFPIRPRSRGERRSLRTFPGVSLRPPPAFNPRP